MSIKKRNMCLTAFLRHNPSILDNRFIFTRVKASVYSVAVLKTQYVYHR